MKSPGLRIHLIQTGTVRVKAAQIKGRGHGLWRRAQPIISSEWAIPWLPVYAFAIEHKDGVVVVDTGSATHLKKLPRWHPFFQLAAQFDIEPEQEIGPQLRALGIGPRDVRQLVLTHMHIDHDGGIAHFPYSRILAHAGEIESAKGLRGALNGYLPGRWPSGIEPVALAFDGPGVGPFPSSVDLMGDGSIRVLNTPGHTPHHVSVLIDDGNREVLLAGDASYLQSSMLNGELDGISPSESQTLATLERIRGFTAASPVVYLPSHDPESAKRFNENLPAFKAV